MRKFKFFKRRKFFKRSSSGSLVDSPERIIIVRHTGIPSGEIKKPDNLPNPRFDEHCFRDEFRS